MVDVLCCCCCCYCISGETRSSSSHHHLKPPPSWHITVITSLHSVVWGFGWFATFVADELTDGSGFADPGDTSIAETFDGAGKQWNLTFMWEGFKGSWKDRIGKWKKFWKVVLRVVLLWCCFVLSLFLRLELKEWYWSFRFQIKSVQKMWIWRWIGWLHKGKHANAHVATTWRRPFCLDLRNGWMCIEIILEFINTPLEQNKPLELAKELVCLRRSFGNP